MVSVVSAEEKKQSIRRRILETTEAKFLRRGFHRVSMDELAGDLGMSKKTLYEHFSGKEELLHAVLTHRVEEVDGAIQGILSREMTFHERLAALAEFLHSKLAEVNPVFFEDMRRQMPQYFEIIETYRSEAIPRYFGRLISEGIKSGYLAADIDGELLIRMLLHCIQGIVRPETLSAWNRSPQAALRGILHIIFHGALTPQGRRACENIPST